MAPEMLVLVSVPEFVKTTRLPLDLLLTALLQLHLPLPTSPYIPLILAGLQVEVKPPGTSNTVMQDLLKAQELPSMLPIILIPSAASSPITPMHSMYRPIAAETSVHGQVPKPSPLPAALPPYRFVKPSQQPLCRLVGPPPLPEPAVYGAFPIQQAPEELLMKPKLPM
jgi:hypothetical protein